MNEPLYISDEPVPPRKPDPGFQFGIGSLLSWTVSIAAMFAAVANFHGQGSPWPIVILVSLPFVCVPPLFQKLFEKEPNLRFSSTWHVLLLLFVCAQPVLMLLGGTLIYSIDWRGKGLHWFFYILDAEAGVTWWPVYIIGSVMLAIALDSRRSESFLQVALLAVFGNALISFYYVFAGVFLNYVEQEYFGLMAPLSAGICYALFSILLFRVLKHRNRLDFNLGAIAGFATLWVVTTLVKIPLAMSIFHRLPPEPNDCFVVTAAARGHRRWVGSWYDQSRSGYVNQQLLVMWKFESWLIERFPIFHRGLRRVYNRVGPFVARRIRFRWQADLVFVMLKPIEWTAAFVLRLVR